MSPVDANRQPLRAHRSSGGGAPTIKISVVIPVYNRRRSLEAALRSVLSQSFPAHEILVIDDGSDKDDSESLKMSFPDPRLRFVRQDNAGGGAARNHGIDISTGTHVAFLDSDDRFMPHHLASILAVANLDPNAVVYGSVLVARGDGVSLVKPPRGIAPGELMCDYLLCDRGWLQTSTICLPLYLAREVRFNEKVQYGQDTDFAIRLAERTDAFRFMSEPSVLYEDSYDPGRLSISKKIEHLDEWMESMRGRISTRALYGFRGWHFSVALARSNYPTALLYFFQSMLRGCYRPKHALAVFLQVALPPSIYRRLANEVIQRLSVQHFFHRLK